MKIRPNQFYVLLIAVTISLVFQEIAWPGPFECPAGIDSNKGGCPPQGPVGPSRVPGSADIEKGNKAMRETQLRSKESFKFTGIIPGEMLGSAMGTGSGAFLIENGWRNVINDEEMMVYAGSMRFEPENDETQFDPRTTHGFVIVDKGDSGGPNFKRSQLYTPVAVGSLHIISAKDSVLTLESRQGYRFLLNVESEKLTPIGKH